MKRSIIIGFVVTIGMLFTFGTFGLLYIAKQTADEVEGNLSKGILFNRKMLRWT